MDPAEPPKAQGQGREGRGSVQGCMHVLTKRTEQLHRNFVSRRKIRSKKPAHVVKIQD